MYYYNFRLYGTRPNGIASNWDTSNWDTSNWEASIWDDTKFSSSCLCFNDELDLFTRLGFGILLFKEKNELFCPHILESVDTP